MDWESFEGLWKKYAEPNDIKQSFEAFVKERFSRPHLDNKYNTDFIYTITPLDDQGNFNESMAQNIIKQARNLGLYAQILRGRVPFP